MEAREDPETEGENIGQDPLARPTNEDDEDALSPSGGGGDTSVEEFVEEVESDPSRAGTDSPAQDLQGG